MKELPVFRSNLYALAFRLAQHSRDTSVKVGCVISHISRVVGSGCNNFADGVKTTANRYERPEKYKWTVHAEAAAIAFAAKNGESLLGSVCYSTQIPCSTCMGILCQAGISIVYCPEPNITNMRQDWIDDAETSIQMAKETGVEIIYKEKPQL